MGKSLSLQWSRLQQYFKNSRFIFLLFLISSIVCTIGFIYLYGNFIMGVRLRNDEMRTYREYALSFNGMDFNYDDIQERLSGSDLPVGDAVVRYRDFDTNGATVNLEAPVTEKFFIVPIDGRHAFTEEELNEGKNVVIIPLFMLKNPVGMDQEAGTFDFAGETFEIIGHHGRPDEFFIPPKSFEKLNIKTFDLKVTMAHKAANSAEDSDFIQRLETLFPEAKVRSFYNYMEAWGDSFPTELAMICLVYALSLFSFMFLMKYMMETSIKENVIYGIVGASKSRITGLLLLDNVCFSAFTALAGILLHIGLKDVFFDKVNMQSDIPLTYLWSDYLLLFLLSVLIAQLTLLPFLVGFRRRSLLSAKGRYSYM